MANFTNSWSARISRTGSSSKQARRAAAYRIHTWVSAMGVRSSNPPALAQCPEHFLAREGNSLAEGDRRDSAAAMCWATALPVTRCRRRVRPTRSPTSNWVERQVSDELPVIQMDLFLDAATAADGRTRRSLPASCNVRFGRTTAVSPAPTFHIGQSDRRDRQASTICPWDRIMDTNTTPICTHSARTSSAIHCANSNHARSDTSALQ